MKAHYPATDKRIDCAYASVCGRYGEKTDKTKGGFTREDHYTEHLRKVHGEDFAKGRKRSGGGQVMFVRGEETAKRFDRNRKFTTTSGRAGEKTATMKGDSARAEDYYSEPMPKVRNEDIPGPEQRMWLRGDIQMDEGPNVASSVPRELVEAQGTITGSGDDQALFTKNKTPNRHLNLRSKFFASRREHREYHESLIKGAGKLLEPSASDAVSSSVDEKEGESYTGADHTQSKQAEMDKSPYSTPQDSLAPNPSTLASGSRRTDTHHERTPGELTLDLESSDTESEADTTSLLRRASVTSLSFSSTISSLGSSHELTGAIEELAALLRQDESLDPLCKEALREMNGEKFKSNLARLLYTFGVDLSTESQTVLERNAAQFVKGRAKHVASCIGSHYDPKLDDASRPVQVLKLQSLQRKQHVERYLQQQSLYTDMEQQKTDHDVPDDTSHPGESESHPEEIPYFRNLEGVRYFILNVGTFETLIIPFALFSGIAGYILRVNFLRDMSSLVTLTLEWIADFAIVNSRPHCKI